MSKEEEAQKNQKTDGDGDEEGSYEDKDSDVEGPELNHNAI